MGEYDLVLIGTPIWACTMASPVRSFLQEYKEKLPRVAFFCTMGGDDASDTFSEMEDLSEKLP
jgi:menaquinone-dependent protoporphyrinogen IX oxidase